MSRRERLEALLASAQERLAVVKRCADCKHVDTTVDDDDPTDIGYRCAYAVPFWVPLPVTDYSSFVQADSGAHCRVFEQK